MKITHIKNELNEETLVPERFYEVVISVEEVQESILGYPSDSYRSKYFDQLGREFAEWMKEQFNNKGN